MTVQNAGSVAGEEIVQAYIKDLDSPLAVRNHSLCAIQRVPLAPGESRRVTLPIAPDAFSCVLEDGSRAVTGRRFALWVGGSQPDERSAALTGARPLRVEVEL